jgi:glycosyltransferase involved in cell wall biosynthesis
MCALVTIAIPTYSRLHYLKEAVGSALAQTGAKIEILIGNDGTNQELHEWCQEQSEKHPQIRYQKNEQNLGLAGNWNRLADTALGEFIVIIGDDDRLLPRFVAKTVSALKSGASLVFTKHFLIDEDGHRLMPQTAEMSERYGRDDLQPGIVTDSEKCAWRNAIAISATLMRVADIRRLRFKDDLNNPELEFFVRLSRDGGRFFFLPEYLAEYRSHSRSETTDSGLKSDVLVRYLIDIPVRPEVESTKAAFLAPLMVNAVSRQLLNKNVTEARRLIKNRYYPVSERTKLRGLIQNVCASASTMGPIIYKIIWRFKNLV